MNARVYSLASRSAVRALFNSRSVGPKCNIGSAPAASASPLRANLSNFVAITVRGLPFPNPTLPSSGDIGGDTG